MSPAADKLLMLALYLPGLLFAFFYRGFRAVRRAHRDWVEIYTR